MQLDVGVRKLSSFTATTVVKSVGNRFLMMSPFLHVVICLAIASLLANDVAAIFCFIGQEPDPDSNNRYRWVIPLEDPCLCTEVRVGGVNTETPQRPFKVKYYDSFLHTDNRMDILKWLNCSVPASCGAYVKDGKSRGNGYYTIAGECVDGSRHDPIEVYCDQNSNGGGWMRFYYKPGNGSCTKYEDFSWTGELIRCLGLDTGITGFAVSDDINTINTENSWILNDGEFHKFVECSDASCHIEHAMTTPKEDIIANLANCKTPTGTMWSQQYKAAYAHVRGVLSTNGGWQTMYLGCGSQYVNVDNVVNFRFGGTLAHTGEFIHTYCNVYKIDMYNSVTSRWDTDNVRAIWIKK